MKVIPLVAVLAVSAFSGSAAVVSLDGEWSFARDGGTFTTVTVPHDWAIAGPFITDGDAGTGKLPWRGTGVYRRTFTASALRKGETARLEFDGVMARPEVFLNGVRVGGWDYGYVGFSCDVTKALKAGANELEVRASTTDIFSRWYPGGGIYRSVRLVVASRGAMKPGTLFIRVSKLVDGGPMGTSGPTRAQMRATWETDAGLEERRWTVPNPILWTPENPHLYTIVLNGEEHRYGIRTCRFTAEDGFYLNGKRVQLKGADLHSDLGPLGMAFHRGAARRQLEIIKDMGCNALRTSHNPPDPQLLDLCDEMGILVWDECFDKWDATAGRREDSEKLEPYVVRNLESFVRRDRNHPSVICWSISNEIGPNWGTYTNGQTRARVDLFAESVRKLDPTRPVGSGNCHPEGFGDKTIFRSLDVTGWNYRRSYEPQHAFDPKTQAVVMTESASAVSSAGWYGAYPPANRMDYATNLTEVSSWDSCSARWSDIPDVEFHRMEVDRYCAGEFVWTGIDYLGEPTPYDYNIPMLTAAQKSRSSYFGCVDLTGIPKDRFYLYRAHWNKKSETVNILPHWNWKAGDKVPVYVYTSGDEAELFLNGKSLGRRRKNPNVAYSPAYLDATKTPHCDDIRTNGYYAICEKYRLRWFDVPYEPGELVAVAYRDGREIGRDSVRTAGAFARFGVHPEPERDGMLFFRIVGEDEKGTRVPEAANRFKVTVEGPGKLVAIGNGDARSYESFADAEHSLYCGQAVAYVIRTGIGAITVRIE